ncbi:LysE/ArgO family amino acid transporter [Paracoccus jiaweipingae]|uniref:LysE/ArgO family amino acid transporter n=1 Tax=unclassified Paracoccus (in: a-proteobacteria) TaxID=2688777 RepID=UPI0037B67814
MGAFLTGFGTSLSLIMAIGAQNAFVLRQGLLRRHVLAVCLFCALSDALLIAAGVAGAGALTRRAPGLMAALRWGGAGFLLVYGWRSFRAAMVPGSLRADGPPARGLAATLAVLAALTWLNPHVYLDTVVLLGAISAQSPAPWVFAAGAMLASGVFFLSLGFGARLLAPVFARPRAWQVLDVAVGAVMWAIAAGLIVAG